MFSYLIDCLNGRWSKYIEQSLSLPRAKGRVVCLDQLPFKCFVLVKNGQNDIQIQRFILLFTSCRNTLISFDLSPNRTKYGNRNEESISLDIVYLFNNLNKPKFAQQLPGHNHQISMECWELSMCWISNHPRFQCHHNGDNDFGQRQLCRVSFVHEKYPGIFHPRGEHVRYSLHVGKPGTKA